jgi:hypothetical protein
VESVIVGGFCEREQVGLPAVFMKFQAAGRNKFAVRHLKLLWQKLQPTVVPTTNKSILYCHAAIPAAYCVC